MGLVMKEYPTQETIQHLLSYDPTTGEFIWKVARAGVIKPGDTAGYVTNKGYVHISISNEPFLAHRLAWIYMTGANPPHEIDHKDRNKSNNKWDNLRKATCSENRFNQNGHPNRDLPRGITKERGKFKAAFQYQGKYQNVGRFATLEEAVEAFKIASQKLFGEFA